MNYYNPTLTYPVPVAETWNVQDPSKIKCAMECWRKYFWEYVLGWRPDVTNIHLLFGHAWHEALAHLYLNGFEAENVITAFNECFLPEYRSEIDEDDDDLFTPKTPARAKMALAAYAKRYGPEMREFRVMEHNGEKMIEIGGKVNLSDDHEVCFRMDSILEGPHGIISREHKTGSSTWNWDRQWYLSPQVGTYSHVLYCLYDASAVRGVTVSGTIFKKTKDDPKKDLLDPFRHFDFIEAPVYKSPSNMNQWLNNMIWWLDMVRWNFDQLANDDPGAPVMHSFPMNPTACTNWGGCGYHDFCMAWSNPLSIVDQVPMGYRVEHWDPNDEPAKVTVEV